MALPTDGRRGLPRSASGWVPGQPYVRGSGDLVALASEDDGPTIGVLALQGDVLEHLRSLERIGARAVRVRTVAQLAAVDGIIIPGGESTTIGKLLDRLQLLQPLRDRIEAGMPAFGTCAGLILLSRELDPPSEQVLLGGMDMVTRRNAFGRQIDSFERDVEVVGLVGPPVRAVFIRAPFVVRVGPGATVMAEVDGHPVVVSQGGRLLAAAFHPELSGDDRLHAHFVAMVEASRTT